MATTHLLIRQPYYKRYVHLVWIFTSAITTFMLALALCTYHATDQSWFYTSSSVEPIANKAGTLGAHVAALVMYLFGFSCFWLLLTGILCVSMLWHHRTLHQEWDRLLASIGILCASSALHQYASHDPLLASPGGLIGAALYTHLVRIFDSFNTLVCLITVLLLCSIIITRTFIIQLIRTLHRAFVRWGGWSKLMHTVQSLLITSTRHLLRPGVWMYSACKTVFGHLVLSNHDTTLVDYSMLVTTYDHDSYNLEPNFWNTLQEPITETSQPTHTLPEQPTDPVPSPVLPPENISLQQKSSDYQVPDTALFTRSQEYHDDAHIHAELKERARVLEEKLACFGISGSVVTIKKGPVVTLFEYKPAIDAKISKIVTLEDDLALALQALSLRIIAPIPGTSVIGFEVANNKRKNVTYSDIVCSSAFTQTEALLPLILGKNTHGADVVVDLVKMPHLLVAGSTGSGKSVALNAMLISLLCKRSPDQLKLILIDPKRLEFTAYDAISHLLFPIVTNPKHAIAVLHWVVKEMEERYEQIAASGARHVADYNTGVAPSERKPHIVVIIDELADLMMTAGREIETLITRIAQMARAAGIHMIVATQRPSVDVITGLIKVNFPSRISFRVTSKIDSRTILDCTGADKLLGRGDMLFLDSSDAQLKRIHGAYVSDKEISAVIHHIRSQRPSDYIHKTPELSALPSSDTQNDDLLYEEVLAFLDEIDEVSISLLQRRFRIGYNRSARIIEILQARGLIMHSEGGKTRKVIR